MVLSMDLVQRMTRLLSLGGGREMDAQSLWESEDSWKDLRVGTPKLPPWAKQIWKGIMVEYYWNEDKEWCLGTLCR